MESEKHTGQNSSLKKQKQTKQTNKQTNKKPRQIQPKHFSI